MLHVKFLHSHLLSNQDVKLRLTDVFEPPQICFARDDSSKLPGICRYCTKEPPPV